jgi:hypothetical protein
MDLTLQIKKEIRKRQKDGKIKIEYRCKNLQQKITKLSPTIHQKYYSP